MFRSETKKQMKIAFITEQMFQGKITGNSLRTEMIWMRVLNASHLSWNSEVVQKYYLELFKDFDLIVMVLPKTSINVELVKLAIEIAKNHKCAIMQEGPSTQWQEWKPEIISLYRTLIEHIKLFLCHNQVDKEYYEMLFKKKTEILPTMLDEDNLKYLSLKEQNDNLAVIGGNICAWYNGGTSLAILNNTQGINEVLIPSMGRMNNGEEIASRSIFQKEIIYIPYCQTSEFIEIISQAKIAVHLMPTIAAGSFNLICAYLGIPCIGSNELDTQSICFPDLSIDLCDINMATYLSNKLLNDKTFYNEVSEKAKEKAKYFYSKTVIERLRGILC